MRVKNQIEACARVCNHRAHTRNETLLTKVAVHRCSFAQSKKPFWIEDSDLDAIGLAARFAITEHRAPGYYTKGTIPYTFLIRPNGTIEQLLPVKAVASHAMRWNVPAVGIALVGDFRIKEPTEAQYEAAAAFCGLWYNYGLKIFAHDELPFASSDVNKQCPGKKISMRKFRNACKAAGAMISKAQARERLEKLGVVF